MEPFGRYELVRKIATGGMAEIYLARQQGGQGADRFVVIKRILPHLAENSEFVEMFLHEARVAVRLNHPNIVQIFDLGHIAKSFFIAMEYIHGEDARRVWRRSEEVGDPIPVPLVCRIIVDAAAGLDYAHKKLDQNGQPLNIIHRDISPQNILVSFDGAVKVVDFGIAKAADQATQTRSGVLKGKYSYMSPEQASGREIDQRTDQFALATVFYELLTFRRLFKRASDIQTLAAVTECRVPAPSEVNPRVPKSLDALVMKGLQKDREARYRDLAEMQAALEAWLEENGTPATAAHLGSYLQALYADRISREKEAGLPLFGDGSEPSGSVNGKPQGRRTGMSRSVAPGGGRPEPGNTQLGRKGSRTGAGQVRRDSLDQRPAPPVPPSALPEPPPDEEVELTPVEPITGSSVSRLVNRMSGRKRAAIGVGAVAAVAAVAAFLALQPPGKTIPGTRVPSHEPVAAPASADASAVEPQAGDPAQPGRASLRIITVPPGASLVFDGRVLNGRTPSTISDAELGEHELLVTLKGYQDKRLTVTLDHAGDVEPLTVELQRLEASVELAIESIPTGAEASVDGRPVGRTPTRVKLQGARAVEIALAKDGYLPRKQLVTLNDEPEQRLKLELDRRASAVLVPQPQPPNPQHGGNANPNPNPSPNPNPAPSGSGVVEVNCDPPATLWEGMTELGSTPFKGKLPQGSHQLTLANREQGLSYSFTVNVRPDQPVSRDFKFGEGFVQFIVMAGADMSGADVYLLKRKVATIPGPRFSVIEGDHVFVLVNDELKRTKKVQVTVKPGEVVKVKVNMLED